MTKKDYITLADALKPLYGKPEITLKEVLDNLVCAMMWDNCRFRRQVWLDYIAGKCGENGGKK